MHLSEDDMPVRIMVWKKSLRASRTSIWGSVAFPGVLSAILDETQRLKLGSPRLRWSDSALWVISTFVVILKSKNSLVRGCIRVVSLVAHRRIYPTHRQVTLAPDKKGDVGSKGLCVTAVTDAGLMLNTDPFKELWLLKVFSGADCYTQQQFAQDLGGSSILCGFQIKATHLHEMDVIAEIMGLLWKYFGEDSCFIFCLDNCNWSFCAWNL